MSGQGEMILKADKALGVLFGFANVCEVRDSSGALRPYFDSQGDATDFDALAKAALDYVLNGAEGREEHGSSRAGRVVFVMPLSQDIASAVGLGKIRKTGLLIGYRPDDPALLDKYEGAGGFSIAGSCTREGV